MLVLYLLNDLILTKSLLYINLTLSLGRFISGIFYFSFLNNCSAPAIVLCRSNTLHDLVLILYTAAGTLTTSEKYPTLALDQNRTGLQEKEIEKRTALQESNACRSQRGGTKLMTSLLKSAVYTVCVCVCVYLCTKALDNTTYTHHNTLFRDTAGIMSSFSNFLNWKKKSVVLSNVFFFSFYKLKRNTTVSLAVC